MRTIKLTALIKQNTSENTEVLLRELLKLLINGGASKKKYQIFLNQLKTNMKYNIIWGE